MGRNDDCNFAVVRGDKYPMLLGNRLDYLRVVNGFGACLGDDRFDIAQRGVCDLNSETIDPVNCNSAFFCTVLETVSEEPERTFALTDSQSSLQATGTVRWLELHGNGFAGLQLKCVM